MEKEFRIIRNYYGTGPLYSRSKMIIESGLTVLVGCNGAGKSTVIKQMKDHLDVEKVFVKSFDNLTQGASFAREKAGIRGDVQFLSMSLCSSEGENILMNIGRFASTIRNLMERINTDNLKDNEKDYKKDQIFIFLDATDSGMSIDKIIDVKDFLKDTVIPDCRNSGVEPFIVISTNAYEFANGESCYDVQHMEYVRFNSYDEYKDFILKSAKYKENIKGDEE